MGTEQRPRSIEELFAKSNEAAIMDAMSHDYTLTPEDAAKSEQVEDMTRLFLADPTIRISRGGTVWVSARRDDGIPTEKGGKKGLVERWNEYDSLPDARREIFEGVVIPYGIGGEERQLRIDAARLVSQNIIRLQSPHVTRNELAQMNQETMAELARLRYVTSTIPERQQVVDLMDRSTKPDSKDRVNTPAGRMEENAARVRIIGDMTVDDITYNKAKKRVNKFDAALDYMDAVAMDVVRRSDAVGELRVGTGAFDEEISRYLEEVNRLLSPSRGILIAQPYLTVATIARHDLFARGEADDIIKVGERAGLEVATKICRDSFVPYADLKDPDLQKQRVIEVGKKLRECVYKARRLRYTGDPKPPREKRKTKVELFWERVDNL